MLKIYLKSGRERPVRSGHPWIFSGAIRKIEGNGEPGEPCIVIGDDAAMLGCGYYNAKSSIAVRMLTGGTERFTLKTLRDRLDRAAEARGGIPCDRGTDSFRIVNAEGDFLPGLVVDRYAQGLVVQIATAGMERMRCKIFEMLVESCTPDFIFERSDTDARGREGLPLRAGLQCGRVPEPLVIHENGLCFAVDLAKGNKTGFYFDQRCNRALAREYAGGRRCLDCFSYSGAFGLNLLAGNAVAVTAVDMAKSSSALRSRNITLNRFDVSRMENICEDVFDYLRAVDRSYELVVLDPPKFARHLSEVPRAARGYKDINRAAMKKIEAGGILFTFSCSNAVDARLFRQIVFAAAADAGRQVQVLHVLSAGPDHPVNLAHPEGEYLKGLALKVL